MPFILFTEQEKQSANASDIRSFLASHGQEVKRSGREYTWESPSGKVSINGSEWYSQYERVGGGAISFVQKFFGASYPDAVRSLLGSHAGQAPTDQNGTFHQSKSKETQTELVLPEKSADMRRLYGYLLNERCLDRDVVHAFVHEGFLYEDVPNHNPRLQKIWDQADNTDKLILRYLSEGYTQREIATKIGITQAAISLRLTKMKK